MYLSKPLGMNYLSSLERSVAQEVVANAVQKLIGVDVTAADIDAAIAETLEGRPQ